MRRLLPIALLITGCQQAMQVPEPTLQRPQIVAQAAPAAPQRPIQNSPQPHPYQYLAPQPAQHPWIPYAGVAPRPWRWIVIHHSDTKTGCAAAFDRYHTDVHHWDELGYHFVIATAPAALTARWKSARAGPS